jgi:hypothetical protein
MERIPPASTTGVSGFWSHRYWTFILAALILWQAWMTLTLFGPDRPLRHIFSNEPIVSGKHPLHLYHGYLGAESFYNTGSLCCYDPNFQAGYPKTPVFDGASRPAELFLILAGGAYRPMAYKLGLALCCLAVPFLLNLGARTAGLSRGASVLGTLFGLMVWWGRPCQAALDGGELDLLLAAATSVAQLGLLVQFDRTPGVRTWIGVLLTGYLAWFSHPLFAALLLPLALVYYLSVGCRHGMFWHLALLSSVAGAIAINSFWLIDWIKYWWLLKPSASFAPLLSHRTFRTLWEAPLWGERLDRALAVGILLTAVVGVWILNETQKRPAARLLGTAAAGGLLLAFLSLCWESLGRMGANHLSVPAQLFAALPAAHAVQALSEAAVGALKTRRRLIIAGATLAVAVACLAWPSLEAASGRFLSAEPLVIGLNEDRREIVDVLQGETNTDARILWEDRSEQRSACWTALLPRLTGRVFVGGLDPDADIEHSFAGFLDQSLADRPVGGLSDQELDHFFKQYNIGWIVCWTHGTIERLKRYPGADAVTEFNDDGAGMLFKLKRDYSYALVGQVESLHADSQRILLCNVKPKDGKVILSLHYQKGMQVSPSRVRIDREIDPQDPINFIRLSVPDLGPVARVTVTWEQ